MAILHTGFSSTDKSGSVVAVPVLDIDLAAYFHRIGMSAAEVVPPAPDLATLKQIVAGHARSISYENLDKFTGREVGLDPATLNAKLVHRARGGGCFEQNMLLRGVLDALGYTTTGLAARVLWNRAADAPMPPRSHMLLQVDLPEGPHIVDVGFGVLTLTGVLALEPDVEQATPHEPFRLRPDGRALVMEARTGSKWRTLYRFDLAEQYLADYEVTSWYNAHHPDSKFVNGLLIGRPDSDRRFTLKGARSDGASLAVHHLGGPSERRDLESPAAVRTALEEHFLLDLSELPELDPALARLF